MRALLSHLSAVSNCKLSPKTRRLSAANLTSNRNLSPMNSTEDPELREFVGFLESLKNYEKSGVPKGAGTDSGEGFDLVRMKRLMLRLHNPHFKLTIRAVVHVAGTKGKGSTSAFLSNILRAGGYSVGRILSQICSAFDTYHNEYIKPDEISKIFSESLRYPEETEFKRKFH